MVDPGRTGEKGAAAAICADLLRQALTFVDAEAQRWDEGCSEMVNRRAQAEASELAARIRAFLLPLSAVCGDIAALRERLALVVYKQGAYCGDCEYDGWDSCEDCRRCVYGYVDAVLADLGLERVECRICGMADDGPCEDGHPEHAYLWELRHSDSRAEAES